MRRIFISTNVDQLKNNVFGGSDFESEFEKLSKINLELLLSKETVFFDATTGSFKSDNNNTTIILIQETASELPKNITIDKNNDYLIWHRPTHLQIRNLFGDNQKQGEHIPRDESLYFSAFKIILDDTICPRVKANKIIDKIFATPQKIDIALEFLHTCLTGKENADIAKLSHFEKFAQIEQLYNELNGDCISEPYIETLEKLRDVVLEEVVVER